VKDEGAKDREQKTVEIRDRPAPLHASQQPYGIFKKEKKYQ
jgi:hypothetical protein